jgi:hypothetical protein
VEQSPQPPPKESKEPSEIELSDAKVTFRKPASADDRTIVMFEVKYRFTKGLPTRWYKLDIAFPGTTNHGFKELGFLPKDTEGVIKDGIELRHLPVKSFEMHVSEAASPMDRYHKISNVLSGPVE